jgi:hypothetical protein
MSVTEDMRTEAQKRHAEFFRSRGSNLLLVAAIGSCIETIIGRPVTDRTLLTFRKNVSPADAADLWQPVVDPLLSFSRLLLPATDQGLKSQDRVTKAIEDFSSMVEAARGANAAPFEAFALEVLPAAPGAATA